MSKLSMVLVLLFCSAAMAEDLVIPLEPEGKAIVDRDIRLYKFPVQCNGIEAKFYWSCSNWTLITQSFAQKCGANIRADPESADYLDPAGKPVFLGAANVNIRIGNQTYPAKARVMRDAVADR